MFFNRYIFIKSLLIWHSVCASRTGYHGRIGDKIPIGVVFEQHTDEIQKAFRHAIFRLSDPDNTQLDFQIFVDVINTADVFKLSRLICSQFDRGVFIMMGAVMPDSFDTLHSYANTFQMPFITPWFPEKVNPPSSGMDDYAVSLRPDYHAAVLDTVNHYGWKNIIFFYDSHDGLLRLQQLYQKLRPGSASFRFTHVKRVNNATEVIEYLCAIERLDRWSNKYVVLDSTTELAKRALILHVRSVQLGRRNFHYLLSGLVMDDVWEKDIQEFGAINVTGFRVLDFNRKVVQEFIEYWKADMKPHSHEISHDTARAALMYDSVHVMIDSLNRLLRKRPDIFRQTSKIKSSPNTTKPMDCDPLGSTVTPHEHGEKLSRIIKRTDIIGLTGVIRFTDDGQRKNFSLKVIELTADREVEQIGTWYDNIGLIPVKPKPPTRNALGEYDRNKTYVVTTIAETPYVMYNDPTSREYAIDGPYRGFCVELMKLLSEKLEIRYEMQIVRDNKYGNENSEFIGGWDGIVGELVRKEVDMSVASMAITSARQNVIDFSRSFLSFEPTKPPEKQTVTIFSFLNPLSKELWLCLVFSFLAVGVILFIVSRFSPSEWRVVSISDSQTPENSEVTTIVNDISFWNSIWFSLGSIMQQATNISPRSASGRIVSMFWWFFSLIVISMYTANMTSYLTIARITEPSPSYNKIAACPEDTPPVPRIVNYPEGSPDDDYRFLRFFRTEQSNQPKEKKCEMYVTISNTGSKEFAIGFPKGSKLREGVDIALTELLDKGELASLTRKWFTKSDSEVIEPDLHANELTLDQVAGLFYVLVGGLGLALGIALLEFCYHGRAKAARANVPLRAALTAKSSVSSNADKNTPSQHHSQCEHEDPRWNAEAFPGYYSPPSQSGEEETALHGSFSQV